MLEPAPTTRQPGTTDRTTTRDTTTTRTRTGTQTQIGTTVTREQVDQVVVSWPAETRQFVTTHYDTFGAPAAVTSDFVVWHNAGPWDKVMVTTHAYDNPVIVGGPKEFMVTWLDMEVPAAKACELMQFNPSIMVNQTSGQVGVMASSQEMAFATFNLAHEIVQGSRTVQEAQQQLIQVSRNVQQGTATDQITQQLNFETKSKNMDRTRQGQPFRDGSFNPPGNDRMNRPDNTTPGMPGSPTPGSGRPTDRPATNPSTPRSPNSNPSTPTTDPARPGPR